MSTQTPEAPKTPESRFYVSVMRDSGLKPDWRAIVGPFVSHANALAVVERARVEAEKVDARACWYSYGTIQITPDGTFEMPVGKLNHAFTAELDADAGKPATPTVEKFFIKFRERGTRAFSFLDSSGRATRLRVHAAMIAADRVHEFAGELERDNPNIETKVVSVAARKAVAA